MRMKMKNQGAKLQELQSALKEQQDQESPAAGVLDANNRKRAGQSIWTDKETKMFVLRGSSYRNSCILWDTGVPKENIIENPERTL